MNKNKAARLAAKRLAYAPKGKPARQETAEEFASEQRRLDASHMLESLQSLDRVQLGKIKVREQWSNLYQVAMPQIRHTVEEYKKVIWWAGVGIAAVLSAAGAALATSFFYPFSELKS